MRIAGIIFADTGANQMRQLVESYEDDFPFPVVAYSFIIFNTS